MGLYSATNQEQNPFMRSGTVSKFCALVDVLNASWALDNLVIGGVPEPSTGALIALGTACVVGYRRHRHRSGGTTK
jgi:hypothetical protein